MSIKGDYTSDKEYYDIKTQFTNVVFEGDVSGLANSKQDQFRGVAYFKNKVYRTTNAYLDGVLKLDKEALDSINGNFLIIKDGKNCVVDLRGIAKNVIENYNKDGNDNEKTFIDGTIQAIYLPDDEVYSSYKDEYSEDIFKLYRNFTKSSGYIDNVFSGERRIYRNPEKNYRTAHSKTPRSLQEFEHYGNNGTFETSAKSSYDGYEEEFENLYEKSQKQLTEDDGVNKLA